MCQRYQVPATASPLGSPEQSRADPEDPSIGLAPCPGFYFSPTGTANGALFDNIQIFGDVIPEPASMAIFGLMGAG